MFHTLSMKPRLIDRKNLTENSVQFNFTDRIV
jgi:hypothetical protein